MMRKTIAIGIAILLVLGGLHAGNGSVKASAFRKLIIEDYYYEITKNDIFDLNKVKVKKLFEDGSTEDIPANEVEWHLEKWDSVNSRSSGNPQLTEDPLGIYVNNVAVTDGTGDPTIALNGTVLSFADWPANTSHLHYKLIAKHYDGQEWLTSFIANGNDSNQKLTLAVLDTRATPSQVDEMETVFDQQVLTLYNYGFRVTHNGAPTEKYYMKAEDKGHLHPNRAMCLEAYVKLECTASTNDCLNKWQYLAYKVNSYYMVINSANKLQAGVKIGATWYVATSNTAIVKDEWHRVGMSYSSITNKLEVYIKNVHQTNSAVDFYTADNAEQLPSNLDSYLINVNLEDVYFGAFKRSDGGMENYLDGIIDEIAVLGEDNAVMAHYPFHAANDRGRPLQEYTVGSGSATFHNENHSALSSQQMQQAFPANSGYNSMYETLYNDYLGAYSTGKTVSGLSDMIVATGGDAGYIAELFKQWDRVLERRDDNRNAPAYNGVALPLWRNKGRNTIAEHIFYTSETVPRPALRVTSYAETTEGSINARGGLGWHTTVSIQSAGGGAYIVTAENPAYTTSCVKEVTMNPTDTNYIEHMFNDEEDCSFAVIRDLIGDAQNPPPLAAIGKTALTPGGYYTVHDDMYVLQGFAQAAAYIKNTPALYALYETETDAMLAEIEKSMVAEETLNGQLYVDLQLNEGQGAVAHDISGGQNDGVVEGDPDWVDGYEGSFAMTQSLQHAAGNGAFSFDGTNYIEIDPNPNTSPANGNLYFEAWINNDSGTDSRTIATRHHTWRITGRNGDIVVRLYNYNGDNAWGPELIANTNLAPNVFYNLRVTVSNVDHQARVFIDGQEAHDLYIGSGSNPVESFDLPANYSLPTPERAITIGAYKDWPYSTPNTYFKGVIDNVKIGDLNWYRAYVDEDPDDDAYYFQVPKSSPFWLDGMMAPVNYHALRGSMLLLLYDVYHEADAAKAQAYQDRAEKLARFVKSNLVVKPVYDGLEGHDYFEWMYWPIDSETYIGDFEQAYENEVSYNTTGMIETPPDDLVNYDTKHEDTGHFVYTMRFMIQSYRHQLVFDREDMERLTRTMRDKKARYFVQKDGSIMTKVTPDPLLDSWLFGSGGGAVIESATFLPGMYALALSQFEHTMATDYVTYAGTLAKYAGSRKVLEFQVKDSRAFNTSLRGYYALGVWIDGSGEPVWSVDPNLTGTGWSGVVQVDLTDELEGKEEFYLRLRTMHTNTIGNFSLDAFWDEVKLDGHIVNGNFENAINGNWAHNENHAPSHILQKCRMWSTEGGDGLKLLRKGSIFCPVVAPTEQNAAHLQEYACRRRGSAANAAHLRDFSRAAPFPEDP